MTEGGPPRHVAVIMDGNGRWARRQGLPRVRGHEAGADSVRDVIEACGDLGVEVLTLYSFSTENWARPQEEVAALMALLEHYLRQEVDRLVENGIRLRAVGELDRLPRSVREVVDEVCAATYRPDARQLVLALSYGGRDEILHATRELARQARDGELDPDAIDASVFQSALYTADLPDPDLLIRTSGELRLSNFLLWQLAYAEIYVTDVLWPEFRRPHFEEALAAYAKRKRRFGRTGAQVGEEG